MYFNSLSMRDPWDLTADAGKVRFARRRLCLLFPLFPSAACVLHFVFGMKDTIVDLLVMNALKFYLSANVEDFSP